MEIRISPEIGAKRRTTRGSTVNSAHAEYNVSTVTSPSTQKGEQHESDREDETSIPNTDKRSPTQSRIISDTKEKHWAVTPNMGNEQTQTERSEKENCPTLKKFQHVIKPEQGEKNGSSKQTVAVQNSSHKSGKILEIGKNKQYNVKEIMFRRNHWQQKIIQISHQAEILHANC